MIASISVCGRDLANPAGRGVHHHPVRPVPVGLGSHLLVEEVDFVLCCPEQLVGVNREPVKFALLSSFARCATDSMS